MLLSLDDPKNTSVSVSPSGEIVEGSSVTLTCSSDANPPVNKYTWYKKNVTSSKASGQSYNITNIRSEDSGEYVCEVENKYGRLNYSSVIVDVHYCPKNTSVSVSPSGEIVEGSSVTLTCSSDANPPVDNYTWKKNTKSIPDTVDEADSGKGNSFSSISGNTTTTETPVTDNLEDIQYASIQFSSSKKQEVPVYSNFQLPQLQKEEEDVQYAPLRLNCPGDSPQPSGYGAEQDPSVLYSTVNIPTTKGHEISKT
ncbi:hypothetical protein UPYG_G00062320 [Umbra pygmaea]|uniref:Ig-like domain-containing protein n=1 Tax=Umbra pygmaea TaxID=75934 RepID=A0ABD0XDD6_UMBPY